MQLVCVRSTSPVTLKTVFMKNTMSVNSRTLDLRRVILSTTSKYKIQNSRGLS